MHTSEPSTKAPARPMRADARRNRESILAAARDLFAERGAGVEMSEVAERAGVGVGTLYRRFPDKDALVHELLGERFRELAACYQRRLSAEGSAWERLEGAIRDACAIQDRDRGLAEALSATGLERHEPVARSTPGLLETMRRLVDEAVAEGSARADLTWEDLVMCLCGVGHTISCAEHLPGRWDRLLEIQLSGLRATAWEGPAAAP
ncbi:MAG: helix-turn-helix domain-containing protein [Solirubrobacterales bacterium]